MKIINTNFHGLKIIKGINYHDKRGYLREIFKNSFLKMKNLSFGVYLDQKKMSSEVFIYRQNLNRVNLSL